MLMSELLILLGTTNIHVLLIPILYDKIWFIILCLLNYLQPYLHNLGSLANKTQLIKNKSTQLV